MQDLWIPLCRSRLPVACLWLLFTPTVSAQLSFGSSLQNTKDLIVDSIEKTVLEKPSGPTATVQTESGELTGEQYESGLMVFRGIPYAAPPVGELRWQPPRRMPNWDGVRVCNQFGSPAVQASDPQVGSEDCLFLNVWTATRPDDSKRPVMVWIHGGGLNNGRSDDPKFDGKLFALRGVVFVSINYRLGALGFLSHPALSAESKRGVSGNYGFLDQVAALKWIQKNISQFGGDPNNVTIFGQSAGGTGVYVLLASPLASGLFHRAILQSPWLDHRIFRHLREDTFAGPSAESKNAARVAKLLGEQQDVAAALRKMSAAELTVALGDDQPVVVDEWLLPDFPHRIFDQGLHNRVPLMVGTNQDEGTMFVSANPFESVAQFEQAVRAEFGDQAQKVLDLYGVKEKWNTRKAWINKTADVWFIHPVRQLARDVSRHGNDVYMYQFTRTSRARPHLGSAHGAEIKFVFNTLEKSEMIGMNSTVAQVMMVYWIRFAAFDDPNMIELPTWPTYDEAEDRYLVLNGSFPVKTGLRKEACDVYDDVFAAIRSSNATPAQP
jgi:para-nitrobenzyl esterase